MICNTHSTQHNTAQQLNLGPCNTKLAHTQPATMDLTSRADTTCLLKILLHKLASNCNKAQPSMLQSQNPQPRRAQPALPAGMPARACPHQMRLYRKSWPGPRHHAPERDGQCCRERSASTPTHTPTEKPVRSTGTTTHLVSAVRTTLQHPALLTVATYNTASMCIISQDTCTAESPVIERPAASKYTAATTVPTATTGPHQAAQIPSVPTLVARSWKDV